MADVTLHGIRLVNVGAATGQYWVRVDSLRELLAEQGIHLIEAKDKAVLDAMGGLEIEVLQYIRDGYSCAPLIFHPPCLAELARRDGK